MLARIERGLRASRASEVLHLAERARSEAEALGERDLRFEAERTAGWAQRLSGRSSAALERFSAALALASDADPRLVFDTRLAWVVAARQVPGVPVARLLPVLDKALREAGDDDHHQSLVLEERAGVLLDLGRSEEAWAAVEQARPIARRLPAKQRFFSLVRLAWAARKLGQPARAMEWLAEARALPREGFGPSGEAAYLVQLGHTALAMGQKDAALKAATSLWAMAGELDHRFQIAAAGLLCAASRSSERWEDAATAADRQLSLARQLGGAPRVLLSAILDRLEIDLRALSLGTCDQDAAEKRLIEAEQLAVRIDGETETEIERKRVALVRSRFSF